MTAVFATTVEDALDAERRAAVRDALDLIVAGEPGHALFVLQRSLDRQLRIAGIRTAVGDQR